MSVEMNFGPYRVTVSQTLSVLFAIGCLFHDAFATARPIYSKKMKQDRDLGPVQEELSRRPPTIDGDYLTFEHQHVRSNRETGDHYSLSYKLRRHRNAYVDLDDPSNLVEQVVCQKDDLSFVVSSAGAFQNS